MSDDGEYFDLFGIILGIIGLFKHKVTWYISLAGVVLSVAYFLDKHYLKFSEDKEEVAFEEVISLEDAIVSKPTSPTTKSTPPVSINKTPAQDTNDESNKVVATTATTQKDVVNNVSKDKSTTPSSNNTTRTVEPPKKKQPEFLMKKYPSGEKYEGYVNSMGQKHGKGTYVWLNGDKYVGDWVNDKAKGQGIYYSKKGWRYEGQFSNSVFHGTGTYYFENGKSKKGTWKNGEYQK